MSKMNVRLKDRQNGKTIFVDIEAKSLREARQKAMEVYGVAYEVL